ncbi:protein adenylyltransferase SelO [Alkalimonas mucilaginosa]|uniref:Protein nucleotidyltransferase YdiU n=1 Tax=Alkalimonas mucilaginosa TaxID=3057676 RepID=A0ABU7JBZ2_9GAMM|nr:YdiU family protein [Alkalimonas sp. MEB004]MEE2023217.1 YdiU family protein [Alkalimonas sp. MEB004]
MLRNKLLRTRFTIELSRSTYEHQTSIETYLRPLYNEDPRSLWSYPLQVDHSYARLPDVLFQPWQASPVANPHWLAFNQLLAAELALPENEGQTEQGLQQFAGNAMPSWAKPLVQAYAGHQFGQYNPQLGDGRALLLAEVMAQDSKRYDVQLKGAGPTPFSRGGDGRSAIGPVIREYLVSEAMQVLGVPTTRALAAVATGQKVYRDEPVPGAVLTRVASSHIRIGTFQYIAALGNPDYVRQFTDYVIDRHYPDCRQQENPYLAFLGQVVTKQATLIAHWMRLGFIHGVMNTDNTSICGETIDYGPCAFIDQYQADKVFSSIDRRGRYAYNNQPPIALWNLARLAECLLPLIDANEKVAVELATETLQQFQPQYEAQWLSQMAAKIGIAEPDPADKALLDDYLHLLEQQQVDFTLGFRYLSDELRTETDSKARELFAHSDAFSEWRERWLTRLAQQPLSHSDIAAQMDGVNPLLIPRNHLIAKAIEQAQDHSDLRFFQRLQQAWQTPFANTSEADLIAPPKPEEVVHRTFCGT